MEETHTEAVGSGDSKDIANVEAAKAEVPKADKSVVIIRGPWSSEDSSTLRSIIMSKYRNGEIRNLGRFPSGVWSQIAEQFAETRPRRSVRAMELQTKKMKNEGELGISVRRHIKWSRKDSARLVDILYNNPDLSWDATFEKFGAEFPGSNRNSLVQKWKTLRINQDEWERERQSPIESPTFMIAEDAHNEDGTED
ncbi:MAG: hypothetical protein M1831_004232 [Alyxoria varia]|nr:MAG: hypothetical protein M1831_004232 [Alyxoria varia]